MSLHQEIKTALQLKGSWLTTLLAYADSLIPDNQAVHDPKKGGCLWVWRRKREQTQMGMATVDGENLDNEVAISRAIFNQRVLPVGGENLKAISFEAPLLRRKSGPGSRRVACDLVCLSENQPLRLIALEVKSAHGNDTNLDYGLLEARVYAHFLHAILSSHGHQLHQEISSCLKKYHGIDSQLEKLPMIVEFAVAAPDWYLKQQRQDSQMGQRVVAILDELSKESNPRFAGIWSIKGGNKPSDLINPMYLSEEIGKKNQLIKIYIPTLKVFAIDVFGSWT